MVFEFLFFGAVEAFFEVVSRGLVLGVNWIEEVSVALLVDEVDFRRSVVAQYPWENRVLRQVVVGSSREGIQQHYVVVGGHETVGPDVVGFVHD